MAKVVIVTTGQPSTNPRMIKEYQALKAEGFEVKVFYSFWQSWAAEADRKLFDEGTISFRDFVLVGGSPFRNRVQYIISRLLKKFLHAVSHTGIASLSRTTVALAKAAAKSKADVYIAHNVGALPAAVLAAQKNKAKAGFDAEDFHRGEYINQNSKEAQQVIHAEDTFLPQCCYLTAASPLIAEAYTKLYQLNKTVVINNVFSKKYLQPFRPSLASEPLRLFWFSQTVGANRGLETVAKAVELLKDRCSIELYLMGNVANGYEGQLLQNMSDRKTVHWLSPVSPDEVFGISARFDVGLSLETPYYQNRDLCLTNKLFTYLLAGNCIVMTNTKAQQEFIARYPQAGYTVQSGDEFDLANVLLRLHNNRHEVNEAKQKSLRLAAEIFNWENEAKTFISLISEFTGYRRRAI